MPPKLIPARPYSNFLTPLFHRQFISSALIAFCVCYVASLFLLNEFSIWTAQPFSLAGLRAVFIFGEASLLVFTIRIWAFQTGRNTTKSPFESFRLALFSPNLVFVNIVLYLASAFFFGEISVFSATEESRLWIVDQGGPADRPQINERSILFRTEFLVLALVQSIYHIACCVDEVKIPLNKTSNSATTFGIYSILYALPQLVAMSIVKPAIAIAVGWFSYYNLYRYVLWNWAFNTFKFTHDFPRNSAPRRSGVPAVLNLQGKFLYHAFLLTFIWEATNYVFTEFIATPPLKKGAPITADSKDPNGTLLLGLRTRRQNVKTFAFWELSLISSQFEGRRASIYTELDRANGSTWAQIYALGTSQLIGIQDRIKLFTEGDAKPTAPLPKPQQTLADGIQIKASRESVIKSSRPPGTLRNKAVGMANNFAREAGSHPGAVPPPRKLLEAGVNKLFTQEQRDRMGSDALYKKGDGLMDKLFSLTITHPLCQPFARRIQGVICGSPTSRASIIVDAVSSLSALAVHSLKQDSPGQVQKSVGSLARIIATTITDIQNFILTAPPHWTDVRFQPKNREELPEDVAAILAALKNGLEEIVKAFGEYFDALGVSGEEAKAWKALVATEDPIPRPVTPERRPGR